jgi:hypothetical protein
MPFKEPLITSAAELPQHLQNVLADAPTNVDRRTGAELVTRHMFPVSYRSLEAWPLPTRYVNGKAVIPTAALFELAYAKLSAAPVITYSTARKREAVSAA